MIGRADIEGSKSHVAMDAWRPQASSFIPNPQPAFPLASLGIQSSLLGSSKEFTSLLMGVARSLSKQGIPLKLTHTLACVTME